VLEPTGRSVPNRVPEKFPVLAVKVRAKRFTFLDLSMIGVCLGNVSATTYISGDVVESIGGQEKVTRETRMVEYGIVANLHRSAESRIALVGRSLADLMGLEAATTPMVHRMGKGVGPPA
jgi:hypothetical protein